jgi:predicted double-glycine peptidase
VPSSIATILRLYGLEYTEGDLAYALHTTTMGTDYSRIPRVVKTFGKSKGLRATFIRTNLNELKKLDKPAVLYVYVGRIKHATALLGFEGDEVILGEPLVGIKRIKINQFQNKTQWSGLATLISEEAI